MKKLFTLLFAFSLFFFGTITKLSALEDDYVYINDVDDPATVEEIQQELNVFDSHDGNLTNEIYIVKDNYTGNEDSLGDFIVVYGVTDSGGLETTIAIIVRNVDVTAPIFRVNEESFVIHEGDNLASNMPIVHAIDSFEGDITSYIEITGTDLVDTSVKGSYNLIYSVSDRSGNNITQTYVLNVVDGTPPVIEGVTEIVKRADYILTSNFYLNYFSASDDTDGVITSDIEVIQDNYLGNANVPGTYEVILKVSDNAGNSTTHSLLIKVTNNIKSLMIIDQYDFYVSNQSKYTEETVISELKSIGDLGNSTYVIETYRDTYTSRYDSVGTYEMNFNLLSAEGNEYLREIDFHVISSDINLVAEDPSWIESGLNGLKTYWPVPLVLGVLILGILKKKG